MRIITLVFAALVVLIQYPLWFGKGGWMRVHQLERQVQAQEQTNSQLKARNDQLDAEVQDLKEGAGAIEERARYELGMIKDGEIFVQIVDPSKSPPAPSRDGVSGAPTPGVPAASNPASPQGLPVHP